MKWAVEHYDYDTGEKKTIVRPAKPGERTTWRNGIQYFLYLDIVDGKAEARVLAEEYEGSV